MELLFCFLENITVFFPLWLHKSWKRTVSVALGIQKTRRKKRKRKKPQILKLSIKLIQAFPWHFFFPQEGIKVPSPGSGVPAWHCPQAQRSGTSRNCSSPSSWTWSGLCQECRSLAAKLTLPRAQQRTNLIIWLIKLVLSSLLVRDWSKKQLFPPSGMATSECLRYDRFDSLPLYSS